jgi:OmcA/MtrC family decaheme c-type cytochrome
LKTEAFVRRLVIRQGLTIVCAAFLGLSGAPRKTYSPREKAFYASDAVIAFVRPGLLITINSAQIAADGTISVTYKLTDPKGAPLDITGVTTPGAVSLSYVAAVLPNNQDQYTAYTTRQATGPVSGTVTQAGADSGGTRTQVGDGTYQYVFKTKAPGGFDTSATHTIGIYGSRDLSEFDLGTNYASTTFNFVPSGAAVTHVRDVIRTESCNTCHDQLSAHGGSRRGMEMCVLCHTPQTVDPDTGNTVDFKVMPHKIHMGSSLPSVQAGKPYQIIGFNGTVNDWSTVVFPADVRRCETCHSQTTGASQATAYLNRPGAVACGSCHDNVNFATGANHPGGPQPNDNQCANCHIPQGELEFDASIKGAHVVPVDSQTLSGLAVELTKVSNNLAGSQPVVNFTVKDKTGKTVALSSLGSLTFTMAGPTSDYGYTSFGSDVTTSGYVSESALAATCGSDGVCTYTFKHAVPAKATGTYSIGVEARRTEVLLPGTTKQMNVTYGAINKVVYFSVDGSSVQPRRTVVAINNCNQCHFALSIHGALRNQTEYCVFCHNPSNTDAAQRANAMVPSDKTMPPQGINFNLLVHRIHTGENLPPDRPYIVVGFGGSHNDFSDVRYPAMSPTGAPGDRRNCAKCHVNGSEQNLPTGLNPVVDPQGPINPVMPVTSACTGCHLATPTASHALANTTPLGESCVVCHGSGSTFAVDKVHAQ